MTGRHVVWSGGSLVDPATASVHWSDHGFTVGDGVFETIELRAGVPFALSRHLDRLDGSATGLGLVRPDRAVLLEAVAAVSREWGTDPGRMRITYTAGPGPMGSDRQGATPTLLVAATGSTIQTDPTDVHVVESTRNERGALVGLKTTSYAENVVALAAARRVGASEALFANSVGDLCEGTGSNVFVGIGGRLVTPPLSSGCLAGITRALLLEALDVAGVPALEQAVPMDQLDSIDEAFLVSTVRHVQPIGHLDARELDCPGPLTETAANVWRTAYSSTTEP